MASACAVWAFDFSSDVVSTADGRSFTGKIYVAKDKTRTELAGAATITRMDKNVAWVIMPDRKMYVEQPLSIQNMASASEKMPGELERTPLGPDTFDGKTVNRYRIRYSVDGVEAVVWQWIDPDTGIPLKTSSEDGRWSVEYRNLKIDKQPDHLFEIPAEYNKFAIQNLPAMIKAARD
jgi:hypothetical protein